MTVDGKISDKKLQYDINRQIGKLVWSSGKVVRYGYEYLKGEVILHFNQRKIIEEVKFGCSPLGRAFEKQTETTEYKIKVI